MSSLFDKPDEWFIPSPQRREPVVWFRHLAVLETLAAQPAPIREVPFRRGLNIIRTEPPDPERKKVRGHDVGKTLLTRLLRYCLGEPSFGDDRTRRAIQRAYSESWVAAEVVLNGEAWTVFRPLGAPSNCESRAVRVAPWRIALARLAEGRPFAEFVEAVSQATIGALESPVLLHVRRKPQWLDLLGWIARDQKCRYATPFAWRHQELALPGHQPLHHEDAALVARTVAGLLDVREHSLIENHGLLLRQREQAQTNEETLARRLAIEDGMVAADLAALPREGPSAEVPWAATVLEERIRRLQGLCDDQVNDPGWRDADGNRTAASRAVAACQREIQVRNQILEVLRARIEQKKQGQDRRAYLQWFGDACSHAECPMRTAGELPDPMGNPQLAELREQEEQAVAEVAALETELHHLKAQEQSAVADFNRQWGEAARRVQQIQVRISQLQSALSRLNALDATRNAHGRAEKAVADLTSQIDQSSQQQRDIREAQETQREWLNAHYSRVIQQLIGDGRGGQIKVLARTLRIEQYRAGGAPGEAMTTSIHVLGFDLACTAASICGLGHLPRLLILDGPREGDMEPTLFERVFEVIHGWEAMTPDAEPAFQAIVTTTTPPPEDLCAPPFTRLVLDSTEESGLLLKTGF